MSARHSPGGEAEVRGLLDRALAALGRSHGLAVPPEALERLVTYVHELHGYNRVHRVVGSLSEREIAADLVVDALGLAPFVDSPLVDVGSGAGLPGLVLKLVRPDLEVTLIEPRHKPAAFLALMRSRFGLLDVRLVDRRAEETPVGELAGGRPARCLVAKGFGPLERLLRSAGHLLAPGGTALVPSSTEQCAVPGSESLSHPLLAARYVHLVRGSAARGAASDSSAS